MITKGIKIRIKQDGGCWRVQVPTGFSVGKQWDWTHIVADSPEAAERRARESYIVDEVEVIGKSGEEG